MLVCVVMYLCVSALKLAFVLDVAYCCRKPATGDQ